MGDEERRVNSELEQARKELEIDVENRRREAEEKLDEILSEKKMEFCSRCGKKINSRSDWAGKCLWEDCENLLCNDCWDVHKYKFCRKHVKNVAGEDEEKPKKKETFIEEDEPEIKADLKKVLDDHEDTRKEKLKYYASEYARWIQKRMEKNGPLDWTPMRYIENAKFRSEKKDGDHVFEIYQKRWLFSKVRLTIVVSPLDVRGELDASSLTAYLHKTARKTKGYTIVVLVTDGAKMDLAYFVNKFSDTSISLFMAEPKNGHLNFNIQDGIATGYSSWFNQKKDAHNFRERLKKISDMVSGRTVITEKSAMKDFGFDGKEVHDVLKSCKFLDHVKDTDTFLWKD